MSEKAIGIFDSGIGGTSVWKEITKVLPYENTIYLADNKNAPYGKRSTNEILSLSIKNTQKLIEMNCKLIVVACNTATTNAIKTLRNNFEIPFIGIEPAIKPAALHSKTKKIGVLATQGTLASELFSKTSDLFNHNIEIIEVVGSGLVQLIEDNKIDSLEMLSLLKSYITPLIDQNIDHLVLGCTHYPYLTPILKEILPSSIHIIDSGLAVANQTKHILNQHHLLNPKNQTGSHLLYSNSRPEVLDLILQKNSPSEYEISYLDF